MPLTAGGSDLEGVRGSSAIEDAVRRGDRGRSLLSSRGGSKDGALSLFLPNLFEKEPNVVLVWSFRLLSGD